MASINVMHNSTATIARYEGLTSLAPPVDVGDAELEADDPELDAVGELLLDPAPEAFVIK